MAARLAGIEQRQHAQMLEVGRDQDLGQKALHAEYGAKFRIQHLEGDVAVVAQIARQIARCHAAGPDLAFHFVRSLQGGRRLLEIFAGQMISGGRTT